MATTSGLHESLQQILTARGPRHTIQLHDGADEPRTPSPLNNSPRVEPNAYYQSTDTRPAALLQLCPSDHQSRIQRIVRDRLRAALAVKNYHGAQDALSHRARSPHPTAAEVVALDLRNTLACPPKRHTVRRPTATPPTRNDNGHGLSSPMGMATPEQELFVMTVPSRALAIHLARLRGRGLSGRDFRATADRAFRVLLEEALASVPLRHVEVTTYNGLTCPGIVADRPPCAVIMGACGYPMLEAFRAIQPDRPTGSITLASDNTTQIGGRVTLRKMCAPADLRSHNIFLLDATCATALEALVAIQSLMNVGAQEASIYFVTLVISAAAVAEICHQFPRVHIVAAAVDPDVASGGDVAPGVGSFQERYFNTTTIHHSALGSVVDV